MKEQRKPRSARGVPTLTPHSARLLQPWHHVSSLLYVTYQTAVQQNRAIVPYLCISVARSRLASGRSYLQGYIAGHSKRQNEQIEVSAHMLGDTSTFPLFLHEPEHLPQ